MKVTDLKSTSFTVGTITPESESNFVLELHGDEFLFGKILLSGLSHEVLQQSRLKKFVFLWCLAGLSKREYALSRFVPSSSL